MLHGRPQPTENLREVSALGERERLSLDLNYGHGKIQLSVHRSLFAVTIHNIGKAHGKINRERQTENCELKDHFWISAIAMA
jgi:hypothetical protein